MDILTCGVCHTDLHYWYGDCLPSRDFPMLVSLYKQGNLNLDAFVSERITIDQVEEAFEKMHEGKVLRSVVKLPAAGWRPDGRPD